MGRSVHRPSARLYGSWVWLWGIACVQERRLRSQRTSCEVLLIARRCPVCQQKWRRSSISGDGTDDSGGGTLLGSFRSSGRCSLTWAALPFVTICLDKSGERLSGRAAGGPCASNRASPLEPRIAPSSAQRPERAQHASDPPRFALARLQVAFGLHRSSAQVLKVWPICVEAHVAPQGSARPWGAGWMCA